MSKYPPVFDISSRTYGVVLSRAVCFPIRYGVIKCRLAHRLKLNLFSPSHRAYKQSLRTKYGADCVKLKTFHEFSGSPVSNLVTRIPCNRYHVIPEIGEIRSYLRWQNDKLQNLTFVFFSVSKGGSGAPTKPDSAQQALNDTFALCTPYGVYYRLFSSLYGVPYYTKAVLNFCI